MCKRRYGQWCCLMSKYGHKCEGDQAGEISIRIAGTCDTFSRKARGVQDVMGKLKETESVSSGIGAGTVQDHANKPQRDARKP